VTFFGFFIRKYRMAISFGKPVYPQELGSYSLESLSSEPSHYKEMSEYIMGKISKAKQSEL
jgi:hypothetical protein